MITVKRLVFAVLVAICFVGCLEGPAGKDGRNGSNGSNGQSTILTSWSGILYPADEVASPGNLSYWDIDNSAIRDDRLITVYVRKGAGFMWDEPTWLLANGYVRISDDDKTDPSWEYKIIVGH